MKIISDLIPKKQPMSISFWYIFYQFEYMYLNIFTLMGSLCIKLFCFCVIFIYIVY